MATTPPEVDLDELSQLLCQAAADLHAGGDAGVATLAAGAVEEAVDLLPPEDAQAAQGLLACIMSTFRDPDEGKKALLSAMVLDVAPKLLPLAELSPECAQACGELACVLADSCSPREFVMVILEMLDVYSADSFDSDMHLLLLQLLEILPQLLCTITRKRLQITLDSLLAVVVFTESVEEHVVPLLEQHEAVDSALEAVPQGAGADADPWTIEDTVLAVRAFTQPFVDFAKDVFSGIIQPDIEQDEDVAGVAHMHFAAFLLAATSSLTSGWGPKLVEQPYPAAVMRDVCGMLKTCGAQSWADLWGVAADERNQIGVVTSRVAGAALLVLNDLSSGQTPPALTPPPLYLDTLELSAGFSGALFQSAKEHNSTLILNKAMQLLEAGSQLALAAQKLLQLESSSRHGDEDPTVGTAGVAYVSEVEVEEYRMASSSEYRMASSSEYRMASSSPAGQGPAVGLAGPLVAVAGDDPQPGSPSALYSPRRPSGAGRGGVGRSVRQLHDWLRMHAVPDLGSREEYALMSVMEVLQIVAANIIGSSCDAIRTSAFNTLQAVVSALPPRMRLRCMAELALLPAPAMAVLVLQRLRKEVAEALAQDPGPSSQGGAADRSSDLSVFRGPAVAQMVLDQLAPLSCIPTPSAATPPACQRNDPPGQRNDPPGQSPPAASGASEAAQQQQATVADECAAAAAGSSVVGGQPAVPLPLTNGHHAKGSFTFCQPVRTAAVPVAQAQAPGSPTQPGGGQAEAGSASLSEAELLLRADAVCAALNVLRFMLLREVPQQPVALMSRAASGSRSTATGNKALLDGAFAIRAGGGRRAAWGKGMLLLLRDMRLACVEPLRAVTKSLLARLRAEADAKGAEAATAARVDEAAAAVVGPEDSAVAAAAAAGPKGKRMAPEAISALGDVPEAVANYMAISRVDVVLDHVVELYQAWQTPCFAWPS